MDINDEKMAISVIGSSSLDSKKDIKDHRTKIEPVKLLPAGMNKKPTRTRTLKLAEITKPMRSEERKDMIMKAVSYTHLRAPRDQRGSRMPSSA